MIKITWKPCCCNPNLGPPVKMIESKKIKVKLMEQFYFYWMTIYIMITLYVYVLCRARLIFFYPLTLNEAFDVPAKTMGRFIVRFIVFQKIRGILLQHNLLLHIFNIKGINSLKQHHIMAALNFRRKVAWIAFSSPLIDD